LPVDMKRGVFVLDAEWVTAIPWGVIILFGGGLSLAAGIGETGLSAWIGGQLGVFSAWPVFALLLAVAVVAVVLTEFISNTAVTTMFLPIAGALSVAVGLPPALLAVAAAVAASLAFMLPVATPPNAIVFASGRVTIAQMVLAGAALDALGIVLVAGAIHFLGGPIFGS
ncbi:MAG: SLC13 family permease, partial [Alphaproteobacteria bacterium]